MPSSSKVSNSGQIKYAAFAMQMYSCYRYEHAQFFERNSCYNRLPVEAAFGPIVLYENSISTLTKDF